MPRRSGAAAEAGLSPNELRLGKPCPVLCVRFPHPPRLRRDRVEFARARARTEADGSASHPAKDAAPEREARRRAETTTARLRSIAETAISGNRRNPHAFLVVVGNVICCRRRTHGRNQAFVYVLRSAISNSPFYIGLTSDVNARLADHNTGRCPHTASRRPWQLHVIIEFSDEQTSGPLRTLLKSGSGRAFAKRHFEL